MIRLSAMLSLALTMLLVAAPAAGAKKAYRSVAAQPAEAQPPGPAERATAVDAAPGEASPQPSSLESLRTARPLALSLEGGGAGAIGGVVLSYAIHPELDVELGGTLVLFNFLGATYHPWGARPLASAWSPYVGLKALYNMPLSSLGIPLASSKGRFGAYVPVGVQWMSPKGLMAGLEAAPLYFDGALLPWGALRVGYRF